LALLSGVLQRFSTRHPAPLRPVPISLREPNDRNGIHTLLGPLGVPFEDHPQTLPEVLAHVGGCRLLLSGSYHAAVFALSQGVPVVAVANSPHYQQKLDGLARQFGHEGCCVIPLSEPHAVARLEAAMEKLWHHSPALRPGLLACAKQQIQAGQRAYQSLPLPRA
ncbi:MAG: polysaccharide pyruvyl transferase family protein, partial [Terrimicrobiaceae bacterium]